MLKSKVSLKLKMVLVHVTFLTFLQRNTNPRTIIYSINEIGEVLRVLPQISSVQFQNFCSLFILQKVETTHF